MLYIIIIEPENSGNIGAIARIMKNFNCNNLVLVNPKCDYNSSETKCRAKHAQDILKKMTITDVSYLKKMDYLIGTTAKIGTDYNIPRSPINPNQLASRLNQLSNKRKIGLLIGREGIGLTNDEIQDCDYIVTIPSNPKYTTLNISHALSILLYEIYQKTEKHKNIDKITPASKKDKDILLNNIFEVIKTLKFSTKDKKKTQQIVWKRIIGKAMPTKRETFALIGFFKKFLK